MYAIFSLNLKPPANELGNVQERSFTFMQMSCHKAQCTLYEYMVYSETVFVHEGGEQTKLYDVLKNRIFNFTMTK